MTLLSSRARTRSIGYFVAVLIASCAPFVANTDGDGDGGLTGDGSALDAQGASDSDPNAPDTAVFQKQDGGFCGTFSDAIECFDFDETNPPSGLTLSQIGGENKFVPTFDGGSPPKAYMVTSTALNGHATATAAAINFLDHKNTTITIAFRFYVPTAATAVEYIGRLNFTHQTSGIALSGGNALECVGKGFTAIATGMHAISLSMAVDATGNVTHCGCSFDGSSPGDEPVVASPTLFFELGNDKSGSGKFTVLYDDVVIRAQ